MGIGGRAGAVRSGANRSSLGVRLTLLRGFRLREGDRVADLARNAQRVLAYLALRDVPVDREHLSQTLWMDMPDERAAANLRTALWRINRLGLGLIETRQNDVELAPLVDVDVRRVRQGAAALLGWMEDPGIPSLSVSDLDEDLLPGWYEDWVLLEQERFRQLRLHALEALCLRLTTERRFAQAVQAGMAAVACEPLRETAQSALIAAYLAEGNAIDAVRQYQSYRSVLEESLGMEPGAAVAELLPAVAIARFGPTQGLSSAARPGTGTSSPGMGRRRRGDTTAYESETADEEDPRRVREPLGVASR